MPTTDFRLTAFLVATALVGLGFIAIIVAA